MRRLALKAIWQRGDSVTTAHASRLSFSRSHHKCIEFMLQRKSAVRSFGYFRCIFWNKRGSSHTVSTRVWKQHQPRCIAIIQGVETCSLNKSETTCKRCNVPQLQWLGRLTLMIGLSFVSISFPYKDQIEELFIVMVLLYVFPTRNIFNFRINFTF